MSDQFVPVTGGCLCEVVRHEVEVNLFEAFCCHCRICQKMSGAPAIAAVPVRPNSLKFLQEEPKMFWSSPIVERDFCRDCGPRLTWVSTDKAEWSAALVGPLDH